MNIKKVTILSVFAIFALSFLSHFMYEWFPNIFTSIFFPVNESIWEHNKMIFTTMMIWGLIEYFIISNHGKKNFPTALLVSTLVTILTNTLIFTPIYYLMNKQDNIIITMIIYIISIIVGQYVSHKILKSNKTYKNLNTISLISIPIIFTIFGTLTYYPIKTGIFYDYPNNKYGLYTYYK